MGLLFRVLIASLVLAGTWWLYGLVLPRDAAVFIAVGLALAELFEPIVTSRSGFGGGLRVLIRLGVSFVAWPLAALVLDYGLPVLGLAPDRPAVIAAAACVAAAFGVFAAGRTSGQDHTRNFAVIVAAGLSLYGITQALYASPVDPMAMAVGCGGAAVAALVTRQALVWPREHEQILATAASIASIAGAVCLVTWRF